MFPLVRTSTTEYDHGQDIYAQQPSHTGFAFRLATSSAERGTEVNSGKQADALSTECSITTLSIHSSKPIRRAFELPQPHKEPCFLPGTEMKDMKARTLEEKQERQSHVLVLAYI